MSILSKKVAGNIGWRFVERVLSQGIGLLVSIILARLMEPDTYGTLAIVMVFTSILQVFVDSGLGVSLIQKKDADDLDFSTVMFANIGISVFLYAIMFFVAPYIAEFYHNTRLTNVIRVLCFTLIVSAVKNVQQSYVSRKLQFRKFFYASTLATAGSGIIGIVMAYLDYEIWALVIYQLANIIINTLVLWITVDWKPRFIFSFSRLRGLFGFGINILGARLLNSIYMNLTALIIGRKYSPADLAFYNRGEIFPVTIGANIDTSIDSVLLPVMSDEQDDRIRVRNMTRRAIKTSTFLMAPLMMGLAFCGVPLVRILLTEKWLPCVPFMQIFCITQMFLPIHSSNLNAIKAMGRSDLFLYLEIAKKIVGVTALLISMQFSVMAMAYSLLFTSVLSQIINSWPNKKLLDYSYIEQLKDIIPCILVAILMGVIVWTISFLKLPDIITLIIQFIVGAAVYCGMSKLLKFESFEYVVSLVKSLLARK